MSPFRLAFRPRLTRDRGHRRAGQRRQTPGRAIFIYVLIGMMVVLGAATAFALIFDIISVNVAERSGKIRLVADRRRRRTSAGRGRKTGRKVVR